LVLEPWERDTHIRWSLERESERECMSLIKPIITYIYIYIYIYIYNMVGISSYMVPFIYPLRVPFLCEAYFVFERKGSVWNEVWSEIIVFVPYIFFKLCLFSKSESERFVIKGRERGCLEWGLSQDHKIIVSSSLSLIYSWLIYFHIYYHHL
jgi:hypothetical protein